MTLSNFIKKGTLLNSMTATPATAATVSNLSSVSVAPVATVAVAKPPIILNSLSETEELNIRYWLSDIEETDPDVISQVINKCREDLITKNYILDLFNKLPEQDVKSQLITCLNCMHFKRINHPHLGHCTKGKPESAAGLWDTDKRLCDQYIPSQTNKCSNTNENKECVPNYVNSQMISVKNIGVDDGWHG